MHLGRTYIILSVFVLASILYASMPFSLYAQDADALQKEKAQLQEEIDRINERIREYEGQLGDKRAEINTLQGQINAINARIGKINAEISKTQKEIEITQVTIGETQEEIQNKTLTITERKKVLGELLRTLQEVDDESLLEKLMKYEKLSDLLKDIQHIDTLQLELIRALDETRAARIELEGKKVVLEENETVLEEKNTQLSAQKSAEAREREHQNSILSVTKKEEAAFQQLLSQAQAERAQYMQRILQIEQQVSINRNFKSYFAAGTIPPPGTKLFIWPQDNAVVTQGYGQTTFAQRGAYGGAGHNGIDMSAGLASPVKAAAGGKIAAKGDRACIDYVDRGCNGYWGNWVAIEHTGGLVTLYAHMTRPSHTAVGQTVSAGEVIGYEGATGNITGPHLHFTVYTEFFTYRDPNTGETRFSYNEAKTLNPLNYL